MPPQRPTTRLCAAWDLMGESSEFSLIQSRSATVCLLPDAAISPFAKHAHHVLIVPPRRRVVKKFERWVQASVDDIRAKAKQDADEAARLRVLEKDHTIESILWTGYGSPILAMRSP